VTRRLRGEMQALVLVRANRVRVEDNMAAQVIGSRRVYSGTQCAAPGMEGVMRRAARSPPGEAPAVEGAYRALRGHRRASEEGDDAGR